MNLTRILIIFTLIIAVTLSIDTISWLLNLTGVTRIFEEPPVSAYRNVVNLEETDLELPDPEVHAPRVTDQDFHAGAGVLIYGNDPAFEKKVELLLNYLIYLQINSVNFSFPIYQDDWRSSRVFIDDQLTPLEGNIRFFIREAHKRNFTVMVRPILDEASLYPDNQWRGSIQPADRESWFQSYGEIILKYSQLAAEEEAEIICIGVELSSLEPETEHWLKLIEEVRSVYDGQLTYSVNWNRVYNGNIEFWEELDFIGVDAFFPLDAPPEATTAELIVAWQPWVKAINDLKTLHDMPVVLTEAGVVSQVGSYQFPWRWQLDNLEDTEALDMEAQRNYYAATCEVMDEVVNGIYWWNFELDPPANPESDPSFNPTGKPAANVIRNCFERRQ